MSLLLNLLRSFWRLFIWWVVIEPWELAIRVRLGKHRSRLSPGLRFRIPYADQIYRQSVRLRFTALFPQTTTTADGQTITIAGVLGYSISDVDTLYDSLHHPEDALKAMVQGAIAKYIHTHPFLECAPDKVAEGVVVEIDLKKYGLTFDSLHITNFARVKTYRLITDNHIGTWGEALNTQQRDTPVAGWIN